MLMETVQFQKIYEFSEGIMGKVTIRQRNQVTLPAEMLAALGVSVGDVGEVFVQGGALVLKFRDRQAAQESVERAFGACSGVWGSSAREIDESLAADRRSWDRLR